MAQLRWSAAARASDVKTGTEEQGICKASLFTVLKYLPQKIAENVLVEFCFWEFLKYKNIDKGAVTVA